MKIEIPITKFSENYIKETLKEYEEIDELEPINGRCIIHMYPKEDTVKDDFGDDLEGYMDAMHCTLHIYNCEKKTVFKTDWHDAVSFFAQGLYVTTKVFKDLSTMITLDSVDKNKTIKFGNFHGFEVYCE